MERNMTDEFVSNDEQSNDDDGRAPIALAIGVAAALAAGALWAVIVRLTSMEIGYAAWGIGLLVGLAMARVTSQRSQQLAMAAAVLALVGLIAGKAFIHVSSTGMLADELSENPEVMTGIVASRMFEEGTLEPATQEAVTASRAAGDTLSDELWDDMLEQAEARLATMTEEERKALASTIASGVIGNIGLIDGIVGQLGVFDLLWALLAVGTAYRIMSPTQEPEPAEADVGEPHES